MEHVETMTDRETIREQASAWLIRLDGDTPLTPAEITELSEWMQCSPQHRETLNRLAAVWDKMNVLTELAVPLETKAKASSGTGFTGLPGWLSGGDSLLFNPRGALAASLMVAVVVVLSLTVFSVSISSSNGYYATAIGEQKTLQLADGSTLILNTNSQVEVRFDDDFRDINLQRGEAHFEVAKDPQKPFRVYAGVGQVRAVGTAFTVHLVDNKVDVIVTEGRVALASVASSDHAASLPADKQAQPRTGQLGDLVAGQGASIKPAANTQADTTKAVLEDVAVLTPEAMHKRLAWREGLLVFSGEPLEQVVAEISRYTELDILIPEAQVRAITVGGQFEVGDTELMLAILEDTFALNVERNHDGRVIIRSTQR